MACPDCEQASNSPRRFQPEKKKKKGPKTEQKVEEPKEFELKYSEIKKAVIQIDWSKIKAKAEELEESDEMDENEAEGE